MLAIYTASRLNIIIQSIRTPLISSGEGWCGVFLTEEVSVFMFTKLLSWWPLSASIRRERKDDAVMLAKVNAAMISISDTNARVVLATNLIGSHDPADDFAEPREIYWSRSVSGEHVIPEKLHVTEHQEYLAVVRSQLLDHYCVDQWDVSDDGILTYSLHIA